MYLEWGMSINMGKYSDRLTHIQMLVSAKYKKILKNKEKLIKSQEISKIEDIPKMVKIKRYTFLNVMKDKSQIIGMKL